MIQLPYRDGDRMEVGGGNIDTPIENFELQSNYMETMVPGKTNLPSTTTTAGTGTIMIKQKINRKSYKTELKAMTKERDWYRKERLKWMIACFVMLAGMIAFSLWIRF